jgi:hypothetical protein
MVCGALPRVGILMTASLGSERRTLKPQREARHDVAAFERWSSRRQRSGPEPSLQKVTRPYFLTVRFAHRAAAPVTVEQRPCEMLGTYRRPRTGEQ